jgi:hypothetical protein
VVLLWEYIELRAAETLYSVSKQSRDVPSCEFLDISMSIYLYICMHLDMKGFIYLWRHATFVTSVTCLIILVTCERMGTIL